MTVVAMATDYDRSSTNQSAVNQAAAEWLKKGAVAAVQVSLGTINILDLGSSTGKNSAQELRTAIETIQQAGERRDIVVTHIDTLANDWSQLFQNVTSLPNSYLAASPGSGVYTHGSAKSFFEQVAPSSSIALAYSGVSFQWMSQSRPLSDCWMSFAGTKDRDAYESNKQQAAQDWHKLLQQRANELLPGAYLIATGVTLKDSDSLQQLVIKWGHESWQEAKRQGLVSQQEYSSFAGGCWLRSREDWLAPLEADLRDSFELLKYQEGTVIDSHWLDYLDSSSADHDRAKILADAYCRYVFAVMGGVVSSHLVHRPQADVNRVLDAMKARFTDLAAQKPMRFEFPYVLIVLRRR
ncbi:hypothetical protein WJX74_008810 [Apatococcus lobatus]|uniref:Uncharacterized protein n=1 Tax=Apatococcus lobatus TaxID=904363 RepID=A0AAW1QHF3_9CHLO